MLILSHNCNIFSLSLVHVDFGLILVVGLVDRYDRSVYTFLAVLREWPEAFFIFVLVLDFYLLAPFWVVEELDLARLDLFAKS